MVWLNSQQRARPAHPVRRGQGLAASATRAATARSTSTPTSRPCTSRSARPQPAFGKRPDVTTATAITRSRSELLPSQERRSTPRPDPTPRPAAGHPARRLHGAGRHRPGGSRHFYVDVLDLVVTEEDESAVYLRTSRSSSTTTSCCARARSRRLPRSRYRVRTPDGPRQGGRVLRRSSAAGSSGGRTGFTKGIGDSVRVQDPLGFPYEFFHDVEHVERLAWRYDLYSRGPLVRLDHFNQVTPTCRAPCGTWRTSGSGVTEDIQDEEGTTYAAWMRRKPTVHDTAMTGGDGPRHAPCRVRDPREAQRPGDLRQARRAATSDRIERGPGRHGVSNAFYLYLRDPDGHRVEIYTRTTTPATPTTRSSPGTCTTTSAATGGATRSSPPGTPRRPCPRPRRQPAAVVARTDRRDGGHDRSRRLLVHPWQQRAAAPPG